MSYGERSGGNTTYFTLKVKRGEIIDPHMEVRKFNETSGKYEQTSDRNTWVEGHLARIGHDTYIPKPNAAEKDKISVTLVSGGELLVIQAAMNSHARNIMLCFLRLFTECPEEIGNIRISVYKKDDFSNTQILHNGEFVEWIMPYSEQKEYHQEGNDNYTDYSALDAHLLGRWKKAKIYIEGFSMYEGRAKAVVADRNVAENPPPPATEEPQTEAPTSSGDGTKSEPDDLPF